MIYRHRWFLGFFIFLCLSTLVSPFLNGIGAWLPGVAYILYDTFLIFLVTKLTLDAIGEKNSVTPSTNQMGISVLIAARNESAVIVACVDCLRSQLLEQDEILIVDDGSTDDSVTKLSRHLQLQSLSVKELVSTSKAIRVFKKANSGKANSLNMIWPMAKNEILVTIDADTFLEPDALAVIRQAFINNPWLAASCGVLTPTTTPQPLGSLFETFQEFEYIRAFLSRVAWARINSLLVVSGAFAAYRKSVLEKVGGYNPKNLVEDYELIHRVHRYSDEHQMNWQVQVQPLARAKTDVPGSVFKFLKQRQRWFAGFLQTQFENSDMVGNPRYHIGRFMLVIKSADTLQPIFGLVALSLLIVLFTRGLIFTKPILILIFAKIAVDLLFHFWSVHLYYRWLGKTVPTVVWIKSALATVFEPFSFQILRHLGALLGWIAFLRNNREWTPQRK